MVSYRIWLVITTKLFLVLILVVVEDGLVQVRVNVESNARTVLILVVVEDGLVHISMKQFMHFINES